MVEPLGFTRNVVASRYALLTPSGVVPAFVPGWEKAACHILISPALGARFSQLLVTLEKEGQCMGNTGHNQYFIYVVEGPASIFLDERRHRLDAGSFVYLPAGTDLQLKSGGAATKVLVFQKPYEPLASTEKPVAFVSHEREVKGVPFLGDNDVKLQALLPDQPSFDLAINILTFSPGATRSQVTTQIMEQGVLILKGQGIFRLSADWHPVRAGDVIWMAPGCPNWFAALGNTPATYIYYMDVNRDPI